MNKIYKINKISTKNNISFINIFTSKKIISNWNYFVITYKGKTDDDYLDFYKILYSVLIKYQNIEIIDNNKIINLTLKDLAPEKDRLFETNYPFYWIAGNPDTYITFVNKKGSIVELHADCTDYAFGSEDYKLISELYNCLTK